eukprot:COSAG01_NODE_3115_length_6565_cov_23.371172_2_plen_274_part_00
MLGSYHDVELHRRPGGGRTQPAACTAPPPPFKPATAGGRERSLLGGGGGGGMATPAAHRHPDGCEDHLDIAAKQDEDPLPSGDPITQFLGGDSAEEAAAGSPGGSPKIGYRRAERESRGDDTAAAAAAADEEEEEEEEGEREELARTDAYFEQQIAASIARRAKAQQAAREAQAAALAEMAVPGRGGESGSGEGPPPGGLIMSSTNEGGALAPVSQNGYLLSRRGRSSPANASGFDTHRDSITAGTRPAAHGDNAEQHGSDSGRRRAVPADRG